MIAWRVYLHSLMIVRCICSHRSAFGKFSPVECGGTNQIIAPVGTAAFGKLYLPLSAYVLFFEPSKARFKPHGADKMIGVMSKRGDVRYVFPVDVGVPCIANMN